MSINEGGIQIYGIGLCLPTEYNILLLVVLAQGYFALCCG